MFFLSVILFALFHLWTAIWWAFWAVDFMGGQFHGNIVFKELYHRLPRLLACCCLLQRGHWEDGALLNILFWLISLFHCRGAFDVRALWHGGCGGWPALAVERLMKLCWTESNTLSSPPPHKKTHLRCACQLASWTFYDWWRVRRGHCHRGVSVMVERTEGCGGSHMDAVMQALCGTFSQSVW